MSLRWSHSSPLLRFFRDHGRPATFEEKIGLCETADDLEEMLAGSAAYTDRVLTVAERVAVARKRSEFGGRR